MRFLVVAFWVMYLVSLATGAPPKAPPLKAPAKAPPVESGVVTYSRQQHPDQFGRMAIWDIPSDPKLPAKLVGYCTAFK